MAVNVFRAVTGWNKPLMDISGNLFVSHEHMPYIDLLSLSFK